jgi:BirA family biotin operon repressor/biotin-[acetyl-CoA-carboxylase] ligase
MNLEDIRRELGLSRMEFCQEVGSTQDAARTVSAPPPFLVYTRKQSKGRGRMGRSWLSDEGGLYFTLTLNPLQKSYFLPLISASLVLEELFTHVRGLDLKWPNDVYHQKGKLAGVLAEISQNRLYLGVGVNVNQDWTETGIKVPAASLFMLTGRIFDLDELMLDLTRVLLAGVERFISSGFEYFYPQIRRRLISSPQTVRFSDDGTDVFAELIDIDDKGSALVEVASGKRLTVRLEHVMGER